MGCDIHLFAERREAGAWRPVRATWPCTHRRASKEGKCWDCDGSGVGVGYDGRNYDLFAILAGVRNYSDHPFTPIAEPRGLPADLSAEQCEVLGDHSHSWLTLRELDAHDWQTVNRHSGIVGPGEFAVWQKDGKPSGWCQGAGGLMAVHVSNDTMTAIVAGDVLPVPGKSYYTRVEWDETHEASCGFFCSTFLPALRALGAPDDVRIVFGFDS